MCVEQARALGELQAGPPETGAQIPRDAPRTISTASRLRKSRGDASGWICSAQAGTPAPRAFPRAPPRRRRASSCKVAAVKVGR
jgi:hypothetical protein